MIRLVVWVATICFVLLARAATHDDPSDPGRIEAGLWRGVLSVEGRDLPFHFDLSVGDTDTSAYLVNGSERFAVDEVQLRADSITFTLAAYSTRIVAHLENGSLVGSLNVRHPGGRFYQLPFRARHGETYRFFPNPQPVEIDLGGRWSVTFYDNENRASQGVAELRQRGNRVTGTFLTVEGDYRYLEGEVDGRTLALSCYDGGHALLFEAKLDEDDTLRGDFLYGNWRREKWVARRDPDAQPPDSDGVTFLKEGYDRLSFTFPDADGRDVSLSDARFRDKVVIVTIGGSWCPNCHDEAAFLSDFYRTYKDRGVEIIGLMFEYHTDFDRAADQIRAFRKRYGITYTTLLAGTSGYYGARSALPMLSPVISYPTMIFLDRKGRIRRIHSGFTGPASGEHYEAFKEDIANLVSSLLKE